MQKKIIHIVDQRIRNQAPIIPRTALVPEGFLADAMGRPLHDLRISVTDRCNFRCVYCMPKAVFTRDHPFLPHDSLLTFEEIERVANIFISHGVRKIRLTGGEPLLRKDIERLIERLGRLTTADGNAIDLALTTNGALLAKKAQALKNAGLRRVSVSMDALDDTIFRRMNDVDFPVSQVLQGIEAAHAAGLGPIKINMVVKGGVNDQEILPMARYFKGTPFMLRFIEYMDVGSSNGWRMNDVVQAEEIVRRLHAELPIEKVAPHYTSETAERWAYRDGSGEIGIISSVSRAFCGHCCRARLSPEGSVYTCLFATKGFDLRSLVRSGCSDGEIASAIAHLWQARKDRYSEERSGEPDFRPGSASRKIEMSYIGG